MSFFDRFRKSKSTVAQVEASTVKRAETPRGIAIPEFLEVDQEEKELVSVIASSIVAGERSESELRVKNVFLRNEEKAVAVAISSAILAGDCPESTFQLKSITRIK